MTAPIVVGVDKSDTARRAAFTAANLASALQAPLHLVMAVSRTRSGSVATGGDQFHVDWLSSAEQFLDAFVGELGTSPITRAISLKDPAAAICEEADKVSAQLIVVGNRRVQGLSRVLGSIASDVLKQAPCDVLIANTTS
jgi:nucleotide-binding universal stress UspA family protein